MLNNYFGSHLIFTKTIQQMISCQQFLTVTIGGMTTSCKETNAKFCEVYVKSIYFHLHTATWHGWLECHILYAILYSSNVDLCQAWPATLWTNLQTGFFKVSDKLQYYKHKMGTFLVLNPFVIHHSCNWQHLIWHTASIKSRNHKDPGDLLKTWLVQICFISFMLEYSIVDFWIILWTKVLFHSAISFVHCAIFKDY